MYQKLASFGAVSKLQKGISHYFSPNIVTLLKNHEMELPLWKKAGTSGQGMVQQNLIFKKI